MSDTSSFPESDPAIPGKSRRRQQISILIGCFVIAATLWFLQALENEHTTIVEHPVRYTNMPTELITLNPLPQKISLELKGLGFSILWHNWDISKTPLVIDLSRLRSISGRVNGGFEEFLPMGQFYNDFSIHLKELELVTIRPDTLVFRFALKKSRRIKVVPAFDKDSGPGLIPDSLIKVNPESVVVEGPDLFVDTIHLIRTSPIKINRQGVSFSRSVELENVHKMVNITPDKVIVSFPKLDTN